jgi:SAM-dependent methyltransferase
LDINKIKSHWYSYIYDKQENQTYDVELMLQILGDKPKEILEVCCGGGRILVPLAKAGHNVVGFDMDEDMMSQIPGKISELSNIKFYKADAIHSDWGSDFDVVVLAGNIMINIETDMDYKEAQKLFIKKASNALKVGGYIYLDFDLHAHPEKIFNSIRERVHFEGTDDTGVYGRYIGCGGSYNVETQMINGKSRTELTLPNDETYIFEKKSAKHILALQKVHDWLDCYGFVVEQEYGDYDKNPISEITHRAIIYSRKVK